MPGKVKNVTWVKGDGFIHVALEVNGVKDLMDVFTLPFIEEGEENPLGYMNQELASEVAAHIVQLIELALRLDR